MVAVPYTYTEELEFRPAPDRLPVHHIEAEEEILGGIMLDPEAIFRVKDRLKPEHFYIGAHKDIYQACLRLCKKGQPTDLLSVTRWLLDHGLLERIGGKNKLANLVSRTISSVNIDHRSASVIDMSRRRDLSKLSNQISYLACSTELELPEILSIVEERVRSVVEMPIAPSKEDYQRWKHDRLLEELITIYTTCPEPSLRFLKLKDLADDHRVSMGFLEQFYLKSLTAQCSKLLTYEELKELAGSTVREWLLNGLVPKSTTILLASDGGVGKTKLAYGIGKILIQGTQFGPFITTGEKRKILYYQGDESEGDMLQALETLGYAESDINKYVRVRFGWSAENMPILIQDLKEFAPEIVIIDSLSTANRFSIYRESEMEYARPILEMTGLANQYKVTFVIIHHMNKEGSVRGTTAIRNAVSEVWKLSKDNSQTATPYDRVLEIDKSRSRSSGKKYRLMFSPEDLSFTFLGEEGDDFGSPGQSAKEKTLQLLADHRNIRFTSEEIAHRLGISRDYARRYLNELSADGLVSVQRHRGKANAYYLVYEGSPKDHPSDHPDSSFRILGNPIFQPISKLGIKSLGSPQDHPKDHPTNPDTVNNTAKGDPESGENYEKTHQEGIFESPTHSKDHLWLESSLDKGLQGDPKGDPRVILDEIIPAIKNEPQALLDKQSNDSQQGDPWGDPQPVKKVRNKNIEVGGVYLSRSLRKEVKVTKIYKNKKADVLIKGDSASEPRLLWADLYPLPAQPWSPNAGQLADYGGEWVEIVGFASSGKKFQVELSPGKTVYVTKDKLKCPQT